MKILVLNCGSSSVKFQLLEMPTNIVLAKGLVDKIGMKGSKLVYELSNGDKVNFEGEIIDHDSGIEYLLGVLMSEKYGCVKDRNEIDAVGHRVVHGGEAFKGSVLIDKNVIAQVENCVQLAPLHNPANLKGIYAMENLIPGIKQVGVFDTAFHHTIPDYAYMYAIPYSLYNKYGIRKYGFHGMSHSYISKKACEFLNCDINNTKIITCHLGNGSSMTAIKNGKSIDTSMGLTPVEGLIMGTRTGDIDIGVVTYIMDKERIGVCSTEKLFNKLSGMYGVSGVSSDMRDIENAANEENNERAILSLTMYNYHVRKYIGAYSAALGGVDILIFSGGIGENGDKIREKICDGFEYLGIEIDKEKNTGLRGELCDISKQGSRVRVLVVPTNEELVIARDTYDIVNN